MQGDLWRELMSSVYLNSKNIWLTIDIEEVKDSNFNLVRKGNIKISYDMLIQSWVELCDHLEVKSTCFVLGSFALEYPNLVKLLVENGHEIASHGMNHKLVNKVGLSDWEESIITSKKTLEDISGVEVTGYRAASWSMPFQKQYYETLAKNGYQFSSSYFPMKTYMYGNTVDKIQPFLVKTKNGNICEYPILKSIIPFSGGFYLRVIPEFILKPLFNSRISKGFKPILYVHPYELMNENLLIFFRSGNKINIDYFLAFFATSMPIEKIKSIVLNSKGLK